MPPKRSNTLQQHLTLILAAAIATVSATALVAFAAYQSPIDPHASRRPRLARAAMNAAEERAIWARPKAAAVRTEPLVTITGCLEQHDDRFRLTHASGDAVPRSRSWKSAFFSRGPAPIDLIDARASAAAHLGERVRVRGLLEDRELRVRSLQRIAAAC